MNRLILALALPGLLAACNGGDATDDTASSGGLEPILCDTSVDAPEISTSEDVFIKDCPTEPTTYTVPFTISNDGTADLVVSDLYTDSPDWTVVGVTLPLTLPPLTQVVIDIEWSRTGCGSDAANLTIESNDDDEALLTRPLSAGECAPLGEAEPFWSVRSASDPELLDVHFSNGDGTFQSPVTIGTPTGANLGSPVVGDFDDDGELEIVVSGADQGSAGFAIWMHDYDVCWDTWSQSAISNQPFRPRGGGDIDGDGTLDLYGIKGSWSSTMNGYTALNDGAGDFTTVTGAFNPTSVHDYQTHLPYRLGDLDDDGCADVAVWDYNTGGQSTTEVWLFAGQCDGTFASGTKIHDFSSQPLNGGEFWDIDGDGEDDLLLGPDDDNDSGQAHGLCGTNSGSYSTLSMPTLDLNTGTESGGNDQAGYGTVRVYDWDSDGLPDVFLNWYNNGSWSNVQLGLQMGTGQSACGATFGTRTNILAPGSGVTPSVPLD